MAVRSDTFYRLIFVGCASLIALLRVVHLLVSPSGPSLESVMIKLFLPLGVLAVVIGFRMALRRAAWIWQIALGGALGATGLALGGRAAWIDTDFCVMAAFLCLVMLDRSEDAGGDAKHQLPVGKKGESVT